MVLGTLAMFQVAAKRGCRTFANNYEGVSQWQYGTSIPQRHPTTCMPVISRVGDANKEEIAPRVPWRRVGNLSKKLCKYLVAKARQRSLSSTIRTPSQHLGYLNNNASFTHWRLPSLLFNSLFFIFSFQLEPSVYYSYK